MPLPYTSLHTMFPFSRIVCLLLGVTLAAGVGGCSTQQWMTAFTPYKAEVVQGNFVSSEMVAQLKPGMTKEKVADVLGSPLLVSVFHSHRWDYAFTFKRQGVPPQARRLTVFFKNEVLERFEGDPMPSEKEFVDSIYTKPFLQATP